MTKDLEKLTYSELSKLYREYRLKTINIYEELTKRCREVGVNYNNEYYTKHKLTKFK